jgi:hypothetical protein
MPGPNPLLHRQRTQLRLGEHAGLATAAQAEKLLAGVAVAGADLVAGHHELRHRAAPGLELGARGDPDTRRIDPGGVGGTGRCRCLCAELGELGGSRVRRERERTDNPGSQEQRRSGDDQVPSRLRELSLGESPARAQPRKG